MKAVTLKEISGRAAAGSSKLYGNPDVPEDFQWPSIIDEDDIYDLSFMCQINLWELSGVWPDSPLPPDGMLYFFYDLDAMAFSPFDTTAAKVILCRGNEPLDELCLQDEDGNDLCNPVKKLTAVLSEDASLQNGDGHRLFGLPLGYDTEAYCRPIEGWVMLLQIDSTDTVKFESDGALCFFIEKERLAAADFSDIRVMIIPRGE